MDNANQPAASDRFAIERVSGRYGPMFIPARDSVIGRSLKLYGEWGEHELDVTSRFLTDGATIVDVGANIGTHAIGYAARFPGSTVFAFEPQAPAFSLLASNVVSNRYRNVCPLNLACSDRTRVIDLDVDYDRLDWNMAAVNLESNGARATHGTPCLAVPLDRIALTGRIQFIKIDVEGMEDAVIAGAHETIAQHRPIIYFEVLSLDALNRSARLLQTHGYQMAWIETSQFNHDNFNGVEENVWWQLELGVIALPKAEMMPADLPRVTGYETQLPRIADPRMGYRSGRG